MVNSEFDKFDAAVRQQASQLGTGRLLFCSLPIRFFVPTGVSHFPNERYMIDADPVQYLRWHRTRTLTLPRRLDSVVCHFAIILRKLNPNPTAAAKFCRSCG
jgi:hypothetical protein